MPTVDQLFEEAMHLEPDDRELLAYRLMAAVEGGEPDEEWEAAWLDEIERRDADIESGAVKPVPWSQVDAHLTEIINRYRAR